MLRFQQVCGPVMAKGVEDTTFYRFHRLVALNEVGGDPTTLERPDPAALHVWAEEQLERAPCGLAALSTHDTKRDEDVRARLLAAAEDTATWQALWSRVEAAAGEHRRRCPDGIPAHADPGRCLAADARAAECLPGQGCARGEDAHHLERP
ncbi:MAG: hypothetical protein WKF73_12200 [Nocardioidaceae bacterium]